MNAARARAETEAPEALNAACEGHDAIACLAGAVSVASSDTTEAVVRVAHACAGNVDAACAILAGVQRLGEIEIDLPTRYLAPVCRVDGAWMACGYGGFVLANEQPADDAQARVLFESSCQCGDANGCRGLAFFLVAARGGLERDVPRAVELLTTGCEAGYARSCSDIAALHLERLVDPPDYAEARRLAERGCELQDRRACGNLGAMHMEGVGVAQDLQAGVALTARACELGLADACAILGGYYELGRGVPADPVRARELYERACDGDSGRGCYLVAHAIAAGVGGPAEYNERMVQVAERACALGEPAACELLRSARQPSTPAP